MTNLIPASIQTYDEFEKAMQNHLFHYKVLTGIWSVEEDLGNNTAINLAGDNRRFSQFWFRYLAYHYQVGSSIT